MPRRIELCRQWLALIEREHSPELWAVLKGEMANSLSQNPLGDRAENLEQAIFHYQQAGEVYTRQADLVKCRTTARSLGDLQFDLDNKKAALEAYETALQTAEILYRSAYAPESKTDEIQTNAYLFDQAIRIGARLVDDPEFVQR